MPGRALLVWQLCSQYQFGGNVEAIFSWLWMVSDRKQNIEDTHTHTHKLQISAEICSLMILSWYAKIFLLLLTCICRYVCAREIMHNSFQASLASLCTGDMCRTTQSRFAEVDIKARNKFIYITPIGAGRIHLRAVIIPQLPPGESSELDESYLVEIHLI